MTAPTKVLVIGMDSAEKDLLLQWAAEGTLPTLQSLRERGLWGKTNSPPGIYSGAVWTSFLTGASPARHGLYYPRQIRPGTYQMRDVKVWDIKSEPFWTVLSNENRRVAIIDVPHSPMSASVNGMLLVDWTTHDREHAAPRSWPPTLAAEVQHRFGKDPVGNPELPGRARRDYPALRDSMIDRIKLKTRLCEHYLQEGGWDLFMTVFADPHDIGHQCWHLHDPSYPSHDADLARAIGDPIKDVYIELDKAIGKLLEYAGPDTTAIVFSSHGMGPRYTGNYLLDEILQRLEDAPAHHRRTAMDSLMVAYRKAVPVSARKRLRPLMVRLHRSLDKIDDRTLIPSRTSRKCFPVPHNDISGAIRINVVGREPNGQIHPGAEYDAFCQQLSDDLSEIVNLDTGKPLVDAVLRTSELYEGDYLDDLPDLLVAWNREADITSVGSQKIGELKRSPPVSRLGDHRPDGIFFAYGPGIQADQLKRAIRIEDFAPTIAALLEVTLPNIDGMAVSEISGESAILSSQKKVS